MSRAVEILMEEHRIIERVLSSLESFVAGLDENDPASRPALADFGRFFREFADRCHHAKEEDLLFAEMVGHGFPRDRGPIAVMLSDHAEGRRHVAALVAAGEGHGPLSANEIADVRRQALAYTPLLRSHIQKEDQVLYPMALNVLPDTVMEKLAARFDDHERRVMGDGAHQELHSLAERLISLHAPDPSKSTNVPCFGCGGR